MKLQPHIKCKKGDISKYVLIPGDPKRVRRIGNFLENVKEISFNREFLTLVGTYKDIKITATSTGIGAPSAAIAIEELINIGAEVLIRVGTCGALKKGINSGDLIIPYASVRAEGTSREYIDIEFPAVASPSVYHSLINSAKDNNFTYHTGVNRTHDAFYEHIDNFIKWGSIYRDKRMKNWDYPLVSSEMECSIAFLLPMLRGKKSGCVLAVNTPEPLDEVVDNPDLIYQLDESNNTKTGVDEAIRTALNTIVLLNKKNERKK